jgi:8-hydroxy-5-deazaflavin:NADPH oxidoreductase
MVESEWTSHVLRHPVIKAFNNVVADSLLHKGLPKGSNNRIALPVSGNNDPAKHIVIALLGMMGFDALDVGSLSESWRDQPGTPAYCPDPTIRPLPSFLMRAKRDKAPGNRDRAAKIMAKLPPDFFTSGTRASCAAFGWFRYIQAEKLDCGVASRLRSSASCIVSRLPCSAEL